MKWMSLLSCAIGVSLLVIDDGSLPPIEIAEEVDACALPGQVITLSRNLGHQMAIAIGLAYAVGWPALQFLPKFLNQYGQAAPRSLSGCASEHLKMYSNRNA
jgi:hypothetical protein